MTGYERPKRKKRSLSAPEAYGRRRQRRREAKTPLETRLTLRDLASREALFHTAIDVQSQAGDSPGPDGVHLKDLTRSELAQMAGTLSQQVQDLSYFPSSRRNVQIRKPDGGWRTSRIQNGPDKVLSRRLKDVFERIVDGYFVDESFGFRPHRNVWKLLARLKSVADHRRSYTLVVCDIRRAFDSVQIEAILCALLEMLEKAGLKPCGGRNVEDVLTLIARVLMGDQIGRRVGIDTGCPFSPLALNILLHAKHDSLFLGRADKPFWVRQDDGYRYADNIIYVAPSGSEGRIVLENLRTHFLGQELPLKDDAEVYDLQAGGGAPILGYRTRLEDGQLKYDLQEETIDRLDEHLDDTHDKPDPARIANAILCGWVAWVGPALARGRRLLRPALCTLHRHGYRDVCSAAKLEELWKASCRRWRETLMEASSRSTEM